MLEFSWWRGNSEPGTSCFLPLRDVKLFPDDTLSYLVTSSLKGERSGVDISLGSALAAQVKLFFSKESVLPEGEGGFVHLHAHQEGILGKLDSGDKVKRRLRFKADLHPGSHEVHVHCNIASDHECSPETRNRALVDDVLLNLTWNWKMLLTKKDVKSWKQRVEVDPYKMSSSQTSYWHKMVWYHSGG